MRTKQKIQNAVQKNDQTPKTTLSGWSLVESAHNPEGAFGFNGVVVFASRPLVFGRHDAHVTVLALRVFEARASGFIGGVVVYARTQGRPHELRTSLLPHTHEHGHTHNTDYSMFVVDVRPFT